MNILVCIKQVPDMESKFKVNGEGSWYDSADLAWRMNEYDEYAVEQAVQLKEKTGADLTVLCIGPERVKETMKKALAMGCDRGVHVADDASFKKDPFSIASIIAEFAASRSFDLIFTGMQSQDRGSAQVGVLVAEMLGLPSVTTIVGFAFDNNTISVKRELEGGVKAKVTVSDPGACHLSAGSEHPALSDAAQYHEGQEEGAALSARRRSVEGPRPAGDDLAVLPGEERRRPGPGRGRRRSCRQTDQDPERENPSSLLQF